jgi:voltage-gated potassium channel
MTSLIASAQTRTNRVARHRAAHSYGLVLGLIIIVFIFTSVAPNTSWADSTLVLLESLTLVVALWTSGIAQTNSKLSIGLVTLATLFALALLIFGGTFFRSVVLVLAGLLTVATIAAIALGIVDQGEANVKAVTGAVCVYILIGLLFVYIYGVIAVAGSGDFFAQGTDGTRSLRLYFSYVTLATLGYGDYTPAHELGRTLSVVEALFGQLYLVTVVAVLVSRMRGGGRA